MDLRRAAGPSLYTSRTIEPCEAAPAAILALLLAQISCDPDAFIDYAARDMTLREQCGVIERRLGLPFEYSDCGIVSATAREVAASTNRCDAIVLAVVEQLRRLDAFCRCQMISIGSCIAGSG